MSYSEIFAKDSEENISGTEWQNELTELEMIKAAKLILLNHNPLFYLRKVEQTKKALSIQLKEEKPESLLPETNNVSLKFDSIAHLRYDQIKQQASILEVHSKPTSIMTLLAERWAKENISPNTDNLKINQKSQNKQGKQLKNTNVEIEINELFKKAAKVFAKSRNGKHFPEEFLEKVDCVFEEDESLVYLRVLGQSSNIAGKQHNNQVYNIFNFFEFRKNNDFKTVNRFIFI